MNAVRLKRGALLTLCVFCLGLSTSCSKLDRIEDQLACPSSQAARTDLPRIIVFGEIHGTEEAPRFVADLACNLAGNGPVVIAIEHPANEQLALDHFMSTRDAERARALLVESAFWTRDGQDGRTSAAMLTMLDRFRELQQNGAAITLAAVGASGSGVGGEISGNLRALAATSDAKIVALLGNSHARKAGAMSLDRETGPMFGEPYRAIALVQTSGTAWACAPVCESQDLGHSTREPNVLGAIVLDDTLSIYDGSVNLGAVHASAPALRLHSSGPAP